MNKVALIIGGIVSLLLFGSGFWAGHTTKKCPIITNDTIEVVDVYWHHIADSLVNLSPIEKIKWLPQDTLFVPGDSIPFKVDTAAILKDYFSVYRYTWAQKDDSLEFKLKTTVTKNQPISYEFGYKFLKPFITINNSVDNSITYYNYLQFGADLPVYRYKSDSLAINPMNRISLELNYVFKKGYIGAGWRPYDNTISARLGTTILKFKQKK